MVNHRTADRTISSTAIGLPLAVGLIALYWPGFNGFWLGDDFGHLHRSYFWAQDGKLWSETLKMFAAPADAVGDFYRPLIFVTLSANFAIFGDRYWGWFLTNLLLHVACALLLMWVIKRAAARLELDARVAAPLAALLFAASPLLVEGVMWVSARSDLAVTAVALLAAGVWLAPDRAAGNGIDPRALIPLLLLVGLGFKESAAVLPLQLLLVAAARPRTVGRRGWFVLATSALIVCLFLAARAWWFDSAWQAYADGGERSLWAALRSMPQWWRGAVAGAPAAALFWLAGWAVAGGLALRCERGAAGQRRLALAFAAAGTGQLLATLLNLGGVAASGEGGRLLYGPVAWIALAMGLLLAAPIGAHRDEVQRRLWLVSVSFSVIAILAGAVASHARIAQFSTVQNELRDLARAIGERARGAGEIIVLVVPDQRLGVVAARNGQGALVMPPLQGQGLLHRVLPTLPAEISARPGQFSAGLGTRIHQLRPQRLDAEMLQLLSQPASPGSPPDYACWSSARHAIVSAPAASSAAGAMEFCAGIR